MFRRWIDEGSEGEIVEQGGLSQRLSPHTVMTPISTDLELYA